jgi:hypothetical protein
MNQCETMGDALNDAALGLEQSEPLRVHLARCSACTEELARRRTLALRIDAAVAAIANAQPASQLPESIAARIRSATQTKPSNRFWPRIALGAALAACVAGLIVGLRPAHPPAGHGRELAALSAWHSPTATLMDSRGSVLAAPLRDTWFDAGPGTSHLRPNPGVSHAL